MFHKNKIEVIPFREFVSLPPTPIQKRTPLLPLYSFLPPFSIKSLLPVGLDPTFTIFVMAGSAVVLVALTEYFLAEFGFTGIARVLSSVFNVMLPVVGFGTIFWFLSTL